MARQVDVSNSLTFHPSSLDTTNSRYASVSSSYPIDNGYTDATSSSYAQFVLTTGSGAATYVYYNFDTSKIPEGATINSVACQAKGYVSTTSSRYISTRQMQMCTGTTTKGSATTISNYASTVTLSVGSWTLAELRNAKIRLYVTRGTSSTTSTSYICRFYGATLTVGYTIQGTAYTITATSSVSGITAEPATQEIVEGGDAVVKVNTDSLDGIQVLDNGTDVTGGLILKEVVTGGTIEANPENATTSGNISSTNYRNAIGVGVETSGGTSSDYCSSQGSTAHIDYSFDFSGIPENATITSVTVQVRGHCESTSNSSEVADLQLYSGSTAKGSESSFTTTSNSTITMTAGTWTRAELQEAKLRFTIGYYGGAVVGATWTVVYEIPTSGDQYYYEYELTGIAADHVITIGESGPFIPPDEDPQYTYYPITISSINATTDPANGTTRVQEGTNQTISIFPTETKLTLALDNGVDITSQLQGGIPKNTYSVANRSSNYGFAVNSNGYYESNNQGVSNSAAVARVTLNLESDCIITFKYINYAEAGYDYGIFGKLDTALSTSSSADDASDVELACSSINGTAEHELTYTVSAGSHYIDVKFFKDQYTDNGNDSLQFKVEIEATGGGGEYTYTLSNVNAKHSLIFVFGDVDYYFITSSGTGAKLYPDGQVVRLAGQNYSLVVVPDDSTAEITGADNGNSIVFEKEQTTDSKTGKIVVNYIYKLTNINAAHNIVLTCTTNTGTIYIKVNGSWVEGRTVYKKVNGSWVEQTDLTSVFETGVNYKYIS